MIMSYAKMMKHSKNIKKSKKQANMHFGFSQLGDNERRLFPRLGSAWFEDGQDEKRAKFIQDWHKETKQLLLTGKTKLVDVGDFSQSEIEQILDGKSSSDVIADRGILSAVSSAYNGLIAFDRLEEMLNKPASFAGVIAKHKGSAGFMKSPNGKATKLSRDHWIMSKTDNFKEFFGDWENDADNSSKALNYETKEPKLFFHGTDDNFVTFDENKLRQGKELREGRGFYFTENKRQASEYGNNIIECFLSVINPFEYTLPQQKECKEKGIKIDSYSDLGGNLADKTDYDGIINGDNVIVFNASQIKIVKTSSGESILDSATSTSISNLVKVVKSAQSGLYALNSLELLIKHATVGNKPIADLIDTSDYNGTFTRLTDRLNIETDATMILGISRIMQGIVNNKKHLELSDETVAYFYDNNPYINPVTDDYKKQLAIDAIEQGKVILTGVVGSEDLEELKYRINDIKKIPTIDEFINGILIDIKDSIKTNQEQLRVADNKEDKRYFESAIHNDTNRFYATLTDKEALKKHPELLAKAMGGLKLELHEKGKVVIDKLLTASPITQDQANEWVARQKTPKNVYSGLAKKGYPTDKVKADLSEFYRLTHGKLKDVEIVLGGAKRANSKDSNNILAGAIDLGSTPDKRVLFHELAHGLEADALAINLARGFLIKRRKSDKPVSLNKLSSRTGFDANEYAYEDDFIDPYVGKVYPESTEVFSMGVECLANPSKFMELVARDPEHAALILQYLSNESEILNATKKLTSSVFNDISESNKKQASEYQTEIKRLASSIVLVDDNPMGKFTRDDKWCITGNLRIKEAELDKAKYVGSIYRNDTYIHIISGSFSKDRSKRLKKGFAVIVAPINQLPSAYAVHKDLDSVKALIYITINKGYAGSDIVWGLSINEHFLTESKIDRIKAFSS